MVVVCVAEATLMIGEKMLWYPLLMITFGVGYMWWYFHPEWPSWP